MMEEPVPRSLWRQQLRQGCESGWGDILHMGHSGSAEQNAVKGQHAHTPGPGAGVFDPPLSGTGYFRFTTHFAMNVFLINLFLQQTSLTFHL